MKIGGRSNYFVWSFIIITLLVLVASLFAVIYFYKSGCNYLLLGKNNEFGAFGDYLGGVLNPVIAFLALLAVLATFYMQNKEFQENKKHLAQQSIFIARQNFENTFFHLLNAYNEITNTTEIKIYKKEEENGNTIPITNKEAQYKLNDTEKGKPSFQYLFHELMLEITRNYDYREYSKSNISDQLLISKSYSIFYKRFGDYTGHYFRTLYRIMIYIENSYKDGRIDDISEYVDILRDHFSDYELGLLFFNGLSIEGNKFKRLIEEYELLDNMCHEIYEKINLYFPLIKYDLYSKKAFGKSILLDNSAGTIINEP